MSTVSATLAAVIERQATGRGRLVETSLIRSGVYSIGWDMAIQLKWGRLASQRTRKEVLNPIQNYFRTADERWVGIFPRDGRDDFAHIIEIVGMQQLAEDPRFADARRAGQERRRAGRGAGRGLRADDAGRAGRRS